MPIETVVEVVEIEESIEIEAEPIAVEAPKFTRKKRK
jgi:hypothetical protein